MDPHRRDQLNQLGSELAGILEDASARAALLPAVTDERCAKAVSDLRQDIAKAEALLSAMQGLAPPASLAQQL